MVQHGNRRRTTVIDYEDFKIGILEKILAFVIGALVGFLVAYLFYKITFFALLFGALTGTVNIFLAEKNAKKKRMIRLRMQFYDLLEALSVAMRAGNPPFVALKSAREDLSLIYHNGSDIMIELDHIIRGFENSIPLSVLFRDFADRSGLEDVTSFASVYETIEGKSGRVDEIVKETQQIISDKMEIEMEIDTLMTAAKSEVKIMLFMPLVVLALVSFTGAGFMDTLYTTVPGRIVSTVGLAVFIFCFYLARKFSEVEL